MYLKLKNPLVFFDLETTGANISHDKIVELAFIKRSIIGNNQEQTKTRANREKTRSMDLFRVSWEGSIQLMDCSGRNPFPTLPIAAFGRLLKILSIPQRNLKKNIPCFTK